MNLGYPTSKNRVSMGLALSIERMTRLKELAKEEGVSTAEKVGRLVDAEWRRAHPDAAIPASKGKAA